MLKKSGLALTALASALGLIVVVAGSASAVNPCSSQDRIQQTYNEAEYSDVQGCGYVKTTIRYTDYYGATQYLYDIKFSIPAGYVVGFAPGSGTYDVNADKACTSITYVPCASYSAYYSGASWHTS